MRYAEPSDLVDWADFYAVDLDPNPEVRGKLLDLATRDVQRYLGAHWDPADLEDEQVDALRDATCVQAVFRSGQGIDAGLGLDDGLAALGSGVSFSTRPVPRLSPEAAELLAGMGLYLRTGIAPLDVGT